MVNFTNRGGWRRLLPVLMSVVIAAGCAGYDIRSTPAAVAVSEFRPGYLVGYLSPKAVPSSLVLLPAPPAEGSAAFALDEEISRRSLALRGTPRWSLAISDADLSFPNAAGTFS